MSYRFAWLVVAAIVVPACSLPRSVIGSTPQPDLGLSDGGGIDAGRDAGRDAQLPDTNPIDMGTNPIDMGMMDMGTIDMGTVDTGGIDAAAPDMAVPPVDMGTRDMFVPPVDTGTDMFVPDMFVPDMFTPDVGTDMFVPDMGTDGGPCAACTGGQMCCSLMCIDTTGDPSHCGSCTNVCSVANGTAGCAASNCTVASCTGSFRDCNTTYADGCEIDTSSSFANCGMCGHTCHGMQTCMAGRCVGWAPISSTMAPSARSQHTAVWTGTEMIVWGGTNMMTGGLDTGGVYDPATDTWTPTTMTNVPAARRGHAAVWTGTRMVIWGGYLGGTGWLQDAASYDPVGNTWTPLPMTGAPAGRSRFPYAWDPVQNELLVWGGWTNTGGAPILANDGGRYDLTQWTAMAASPLNARYYVPAAFTGTGAAARFLIWGGEFPNGSVGNNGARYDPAMNMWSNISTSGRPSGRSRHVVVSTGTDMIVWSGWSSTAVRTDGASYDPVGDNWTNLAGAPGGFSGRTDATAVWTGTEMVVFGGVDNPNFGFGTNFFNDSAAYALGNNMWRTPSTANAPGVRADHTAIWTGSEMIVFAGRNAMIDLGDGARITP